MKDLLQRTIDARRGVPVWIIALFGLGVAVRLALMAVYSPAALQNPDTISYVSFPPFFDTRQPSGIQLFIEPFEAVGSITLLVLAQHGLGLITAGLIACAARRLGCGWVATGAAAAVTLLGSEQLYLEHALVTEPLFTALAAGALLAALPRGDRGASTTAALVAGALAGAALCTRSVGAVVVVVIAAGLLLTPHGAIGRRAVRAGAALATSLAVVAIYMVGVAITENGQSGIGQWGGWYTYARAAPFADCDEFTPPEGTEMLCETTPPDERYGPSGYMFDEHSPARVHFGGAPNEGDVLRSFGRAAILGQPFAYVEVVLRDFLRYFDDDFGREQLRSGGGYDTIALDRRDPSGERFVASELSETAFDDVSMPVVHAPNAIELYAAVFTLDGRVLLLLLALSVAGFVLRRGPVRAGVALYGLVGVALLAVPVVTIIYNARYAIPADVLLAVPAAVGAQAIVDRLRRADEHPADRDAIVKDGAPAGVRS